GSIHLSTGPNYRLLILPGAHKMSPNECTLSLAVALRIKQFAEQGGTVLMNEIAQHSIGLLNAVSNDKKLLQINRLIFGNGDVKPGDIIKTGKGRIIIGPYQQESFSS